MAWRTSTESGTCHKSSKRFSLQNQGTQSHFCWCTFMIFRNIKTSTEWGTYSFSQLQIVPLQNQEPVIAYPCRHLGCPKKWFWRTPGGPDNGVDFFGGIQKGTRARKHITLVPSSICSNFHPWSHFHHGVQCEAAPCIDTFVILAIEEQDRDILPGWIDHWVDEGSHQGIRN